MTSNSKHKPECNRGRIKGLGGNRKVWGCFSSNSVGDIKLIDGNLNGDGYKRSSRKIYLCQ